MCLYLKLSTPNGQAKPEVEATLKFCTCWDCHGLVSVHPVTGSAMKGQFVGPKEYAAHRVQENM
jgi:hypothetical protein